MGWHAFKINQSTNNNVKKIEDKSNRLYALSNTDMKGWTIKHIFLDSWRTWHHLNVLSPAPHLILQKQAGPILLWFYQIFLIIEKTVS